MMQRSAKAYENGEYVGKITCEEYGHTLESRRVWWVPETKKMYLYIDADEFVGGGGVLGGSAEPYFELYTGPIIHGGGFSF